MNKCRATSVVSGFQQRGGCGADGDWSRYRLQQHARWRTLRVSCADRRGSCDAELERRTQGAGAVVTHGAAGARGNETRWGSRHVCQLGKRLIGGGYDMVQGSAELDAEGLVDAGMRKMNANLLMGWVSQKCTSPGGGESSKHGGGSGSGLANGSRSPGCTTDSDSRPLAGRIPSQLGWTR